MCPKGIEASLLSLNSSIVGMNIYGIKSLMGLFINHFFVGAKNENIEEKLWQLYIYQIIGTFIPFLYISCLIPKEKKVRELQ